MSRLDGKVAIVLGAAGAGNMGQVIARRLAAEGAKTIVAGRHESVLKAFAQEIRGDWALCDITDKSSIDRAIETTVKKYGGLHIGVNAAGVALGGPFTETTG